jgi:hypothetical protein
MAAEQGEVAMEVVVCAGKPRWLAGGSACPTSSLQLHSPDIPPKFLETVNDPSIRYRKADLHRIRPESRQQRVGAGMEMLHRKWCIHRGLALGMQPLRPDAPKAVAFRDEIQQIAIR